MKNVTYVLFCTSLFFNTIAPRTIFEEARTGNTDAIKERLYNGENYAEQDKDGNNALHIAAEQGHTEIIDILTTEPTYPDYDSRWFWSWFGYAPQLPNKKESASDRICPHCLDICIQKNKELNQPNKCPRCGKTTLDETLIQKVLAQK